MSINLFAFPFAGGNKYAFNDYKKYLSSQINFEVIELPGRGMRIREALLEDMEEIVEDIFYLIKDKLYRPYAFYGHSMGGTISTLLIHKLISLNLPLPKHLFVTGHGAPWFTDPEKDEKVFSNMTDEEFKEELRLLGGCPEEVLNNEELFNFFLPLLKADFKAIEMFEPTYNRPHAIPITVIIGDNEENITDSELEAWKEESREKVIVSKLPGNHFFIYEHLRTICAEINRVLLDDNSPVLK